MATNMSNENKILHKELSYKLQGLFFAIRNELGSGHKESIYQKALEKELKTAGIIFQKEPPIKIYSAKKEYLGLYRPDFLVENKVIIELKAAQFVTKQENARLYDYLRNSEYELGYLVNFASPKLYMKRFLFTNDRKNTPPIPTSNPQMATNKKRIATNTLIFIFVAISFLFVGIRGVQAAEIFFEPKIQEIGLDEQFEVSVFLNTEGEYINTVGGKIIFPGDLLELKEIRDGNSIINFWIDNPRIAIINPRMPTNDKRMATNMGNENEILFSGIVPGGYKGSEGLIFSVVFLAKNAGGAEIDIHDVKLLLNDGLGTEAKRTSVKNLLVAIRENIRGPSWISPKDNEPPESFVPEIANDPALFEGKWFLVFATQDKGTGIDKYLIHESRRMKKRITTNEWIEAESPYALKDQELRSYIFVKAVDKAGNERIAVVEPRYPIKWYEKWENWLIIIIGAALIVIIIHKWRRII
jgi:GxxExxY protein